MPSRWPVTRSRTSSKCWGWRIRSHGTATPSTMPTSLFPFLVVVRHPLWPQAPPPQSAPAPALARLVLDHASAFGCCQNSSTAQCGLLYLSFIFYLFFQLCPICFLFSSGSKMHGTSSLQTNSVLKINLCNHKSLSWFDVRYGVLGLLQQSISAASYFNMFLRWCLLGFWRVFPRSPEI